MNNLNVFILFSTLIYFKLEGNKSDNLKIAVGLVALYALYNLLKGSEGFINDPAPTTAADGGTFCGTYQWVARTTDSEATCTETVSDPVDSAGCAGVTELGDATACNSIMKNTDPAAAACTYTAGTAGTTGSQATCRETLSDPVDSAGCAAVTDLDDSNACNLIMKNTSQSDTACTYTPAVQEFPAHCANSSGKICGKYKNTDGSIKTAPPPGYADLTDTKCNAIECHRDTDCDSAGKKHCDDNKCVRCSSPEHCDSDEKCENNSCVKSIKCTSSSPYCNLLQKLPDGCESDESKCSVEDLDDCCNYNNGYLAGAIIVMVIIFFVGCIYFDKWKWGGTVWLAIVIDAIIAASVFGGLHRLYK